MSGIASEADIEKMIVDRAQHGEALATRRDYDQVPPRDKDLFERAYAYVEQYY